MRMILFGIFIFLLNFSTAQSKYRYEFTSEFYELSINYPYSKQEIMNKFIGCEVNFFGTNSEIINQNEEKIKLEFDSENAFNGKPILTRILCSNISPQKAESLYESYQMACPHDGFVEERTIYDKTFNKESVKEKKGYRRYFFIYRKYDKLEIEYNVVVNGYKNGKLSTSAFFDCRYQIEMGEYTENRKSNSERRLPITSQFEDSWKITKKYDTCGQ
jgi:hypothetical protein